MPQKPTISLRIPSEVLARIDELARADGKSRTQIFESAIAIYLGESPSDIPGRLSHLENEVAALRSKLRSLSS